MPGQDEQAVDAKATSISSGQTRPADAHSPPYDNDNYNISDTHQTAGPSDLSQRRHSDNNNDNTESQTKSGSRAKPSETLRRSQACLACRKRKLRCDAKKPTCTRCEKAWLSYHPSAGDASQSAPPPCEYDTSLLAKIFKRSGSSDPPATTSSQPSGSGSRYRDTAAPEEHHDQLLEANEHLRAQIAYLESRLRRTEETASSYPQRGSSEAQSSTQAVYPPRVSVQHLSDVRHGDAPASKRMKTSDDVDFIGNRPRSSTGTSLRVQTAVTRRDDGQGPSNRPISSSSADHPFQSRPSPIAPSVLNWSSTGQSHAPVWTAPPHYSGDATSKSPLEPISSAHPALLPLPGRQALDRLIDLCQREAWLFSSINAYALSDVAALFETTPISDSDHLTARALMMATVATGLPLLASAFPNGISTSAAFQNIDDLLRSHPEMELVRLDKPSWLPTVVKLYADEARSMIARLQARSPSLMSPAAFVIRLLLVEVSHSQSASRSAQADLAAAASEARLLHLHSTISGTHPRLSAGPTRSSHLARALRGLMQTKEESFAFWSLFLQDCFQCRLGMLPVALERQSIRTPFPRRIEADSASPALQRLDEVEAYMNRRRGIPLLEGTDNSVSLLVKVGLILDQCCEYASKVRSDSPMSNGIRDRDPSVQDEREKAFVAAHESIRNSRMMLSHFDDRTLSRSENFGGAAAASSARPRESLVTTLVLQDQARFAAEVTHHLAVLSLFEKAMNVADPWIQAGEARGMILNASVWLSRLAGMALQSPTLIFAIPSFCSPAFFIAARWLLFLQGADPDHFHADISTILLALLKRGEAYARDHTFAKAIVALKREQDFYGRICISPFTWPIEAVSEFVPARPEMLRGRPPPAQVAEPGFASVYNLAASVEDKDVLELANASDAVLG